MSERPPHTHGGTATCEDTKRFVKREDLEGLLNIEFSYWQWRWVDLIVNQGYGLKLDGNDYALIPRRK